MKNTNTDDRNWPSLNSAVEENLLETVSNNIINPKRSNPLINSKSGNLTAPKVSIHKNKDNQVIII